ncbi:F-box/kelch-repeat protein At3g23880-like [Pistacia vera]|uniref:F-box/kelch-repeat protein At3g23880-like n=1 Tax=Pistacia vera TaxID=55513 RepID=UPI00126309D9|nr:F-box/kelch-repeat protein At3g23880-like [Pistacia vera]
MLELYEELIVDILLRLPVKSLLRFRCVSKFWRDLIDSKYFINMHRQQSINSNTNFHLMFQISSNKLCSCSKYFDNVGLKSRHPNELSNDWLTWYKKLPQAPKLEFDLLKNLKALHGFGYDHVHDDYKVLRIFQIFYPDDVNRKNSIIRNQICVYSLQLNSWRHIEDYPYGDRNYEFTDNYSQGCFVNGASHWLAYPLILNEYGFWVQGLEWSIVAFNFEAEKFTTIPHPNANRNGKSFQIENLGGFLRIFEEVCETCYVWVMKQYGVGESWIKLFLFDLHSFKLEYPIVDLDRYVNLLHIIPRTEKNLQ